MQACLFCPFPQDPQTGHPTSRAVCISAIRKNSCLTLIIKLYLNHELAKKLIERAAGLPAQPYFTSSSSCYFSLRDRSVPSVVSLALRLDVKLKLVSRLTITIVECRTKRNTLKTCHGAFTSKWVLPLSVRLILGSYIILSKTKSVNLGHW